MPIYYISSQDRSGVSTFTKTTIMATQSLAGRKTRPPGQLKHFQKFKDKKETIFLEIKDKYFPIYRAKNIFNTN